MPNELTAKVVNGLAGYSSQISNRLIIHYRNASAFECARDAVFAMFVFNYLDKAQRYILGRGVIQSTKNLYRYLGKRFFRFFLTLPFVKPKVDQEVEEILKKVESDMIDRTKEFYTQLPNEGYSNDKILEILDENTDMKHSDWESGKVSGAVYHGGKEMLDIQAQAYSKYSIANQLHPDIFPGVRKMESEVVSMVLKLFNAPSDSGCGTSTSGGTESLLLTCLAAREKAYYERGVTEPEIIAPITIHAGFDKAAYYFKMKLIHAPLDPVTYQVDLKAVKKLVNRNTVLIAGSAPNFPHGIIDDIEGLSDIALKHNIPLHVDACLGSFIVPFLEEAGYKPQLFDFRVPGVTSISCDTHKYGFAPKGSSIIMYRNEELRRYQYFVNVDWSGGVYASPTLAGSRPGALMVGCWASLMKMGHDGYLQSCIDIVGCAQKFKLAIESIPELYVIGNPISSVVAFGSEAVNIYDLADSMSKKGWHLNSLQNPPAIHLASTRLTLNSIDQLVSELEESVRELVEAGSTEAKPDGTAALYGVAGSIKTVGVADRIAEGFLDNLYKV